MTHSLRRRYTLIASFFFVSILASLDVFLTVVLCGRFPLLFYIIFAVIGALIGRKFAPKLTGPGRFKMFLKSTALSGCLIGLLSLGVLITSSPNLTTHCSWRHCGRLLGWSVWMSPFPAGSPSCRALHMCVNEYPLSEAQNTTLYQLIESQGCPAP